MGKRKFITSSLSVLLLLVFFTSYSQKKISWSDFQGTPQINDSTTSYLDYDLSYNYQKREVSDTTLIYYQATTTIDKSLSWVKEENKTKKELLYNQLKVNALEYFRINTQTFLDSVDHPLMIDSIIPLILDSLAKEMESIQQNYNSKSISELEKKITDSEQKLNGRSHNTIPSFTPNNIGLGIHLGIGTSLFSENINHFFTHPLILTLGGELQTNKLTYMLASTVGWNKTKQAFINEYEWSKDFGTTTLSFETNIGYNIDASQFKLIPFAGLSYFGIITLTGQRRSSLGSAVKEYNKYTTIAPNIGLIFDYKAKKTVKLLPSYSNKSKKYSELNIRLKLSASPIDFDNGINGTLFNTTIGVSTFSRALKLN